MQLDGFAISGPQSNVASFARRAISMPTQCKMDLLTGQITLGEDLTGVNGEGGCRMYSSEGPGFCCLFADCWEL